MSFSNFSTSQDADIVSVNYVTDAKSDPFEKYSYYLDGFLPTVQTFRSSIPRLLITFNSTGPEQETGFEATYRSVSVAG